MLCCRFLALVVMVPFFDLIFIEFPNQNYSHSLILEANDTINTIKDKFNRQYGYLANRLGPQRTLQYKGKVLTVNDDLKKLPKDSVLHVVEDYTSLDFFSELLSMDSSKDAEKISEAVEQFFCHFKNDRQRTYNRRERTPAPLQSTKYAIPIRCNCWAAFTLAMLLHFATTQKQVLEKFEAV